MNIFARIAKGDSAAWTDDPFLDTNGKTYDATTYVLTYAIRGSTILDLIGSAVGPKWAFTLTTTQSGALVAGTYWWTANATRTGERLQAGSGSFLVTPDYVAATAGFDGTSQNEKDLAAVKAEISARVSGGATLEYTIGNRSLKKEPMSALLDLQDRLTRIVRRERQAEQIANGQGNPRRVFGMFRR